MTSQGNSSSVFRAMPRNSTSDRSTKTKTTNLNLAQGTTVDVLRITIDHPNLVVRHLEVKYKQEELLFKEVFFLVFV
jgi:hypothetical protein